MNTAANGNRVRLADVRTPGMLLPNANDHFRQAALHDVDGHERPLWAVLSSQPWRGGGWLRPHSRRRRGSECCSSGERRLCGSRTAVVDHIGTFGIGQVYIAKAHHS